MIRDVFLPSFLRANCYSLVLPNFERFRNLIFSLPVGTIDYLLGFRYNVVAGFACLSSLSIFLMEMSDDGATPTRRVNGLTIGVILGLAKTFYFLICRETAELRPFSLSIIHASIYLVRELTCFLEDYHFI